MFEIFVRAARCVGLGLVFAPLATLGAACSSSNHDQPAPDGALSVAGLDAAVGDPDAGAPEADALPPNWVSPDSPPDLTPGTPGACVIEELSPPNEGAMHTTTCGAVAYGSRPPSSGTHYPIWAVFRTYAQPVPWGFLVHDLEHGAVIIAYNCGTTPCDAELAAVQAVVDTIPKRSCGKAPVIVVPDPTLDVRFAATAWGHVLRASCFDPAPFTTFINAHINLGPELIAQDCGAVDLEAMGWCGK